ncbi:DUF192 domain-containing protein [Spirulina sp. CCNP1310]|uniref:DUF192 domain-containing protein n=1 Tax=Spirulina sp. CCNP1310 TaxID=3110249 RepID=UPI002B21C95C|nr:DUF192 domain-containing protein [Spirulina sp. CCNP1310]MEA5420453.1 DUF192 domain-containing protein [Spirulina sp. CCNP1310]
MREQNKQKQIVVLMVGLSLSFFGCSPLEVESVPTPSPTVAKEFVIEPYTTPQLLPIGAIARFEAVDLAIELEVATTPEEQARGLMFRQAESLPDNRGMIFPFDPPRQVSFWMKNVPIGLDMVFIYQGEIIEIAQNVPGCSGEPCPTYGPDQLVDHVIELRGGRAEAMGLAVGDGVELEFLSP